MFRRKVKLPTTLQEFDDLAALVVKRYNLVDAHHAAAVLSVAIRHLPPEQAYARLDYLGHYILKNIANHVANHKGQVLQHEAQIDQLASLVEYCAYAFYVHVCHWVGVECYPHPQLAAK